MRDVSAARESQSRTQRYACLAAMAVVFLFVVTLSGSSNKNASSEIVNGQSKHVHVHTKTENAGDTPLETSSTNKDFDGDNSDSFGGSNFMDENKEMDEAERKFKKAVDDQKSINDGTLSIETTKCMGAVRDGLGSVLDTSGLDFSTDETDLIVQSIWNQLNDDVENHVKGEIDTLYEDKKSEYMLDLDQDVENTKAEGELEAEAQMDEIANLLQAGIDDIYEKTKEIMPELTANAEKKVLESCLKKKTNEPYAAEIVGSKVVSITKGVPKVTKQAAAGKITKKASVPTPSPSKTTKKTTKRVATAPPTPQSEDSDDEDSDDEDSDDEDSDDEDSDDEDSDDEDSDDEDAYN